MRRVFTFAVVIAIVADARIAAAVEFANAVVRFTPGVGDVGSADLVAIDPCRVNVRPLDLNDALGFPDHEYVAVGDQGEIVLGFAQPIIDVPGDDVRVWVSCNSACESGKVYVGDDLVTLHLLGPIVIPPYQSYDIASSGLASARYVVIVDNPGIERYCQPGVGLALDVDAVESLHTPLPAASSTWSAIKALYR